MQGDSLRGETCVQGNGQLAAAGHVQREALFVDPARHLGAQERLGGVADVFTAADRSSDFAAT